MRVLDGLVEMMRSGIVNEPQVDRKGLGWIITGIHVSFGFDIRLRDSDFLCEILTGKERKSRVRQVLWTEKS